MVEQIRNSNLIFDIGMSEGNDTEFYLQKGFNVVGVEADNSIIGHLHDRFSDEISMGRLIVIHAAISDRSNEEISFWHIPNMQGSSSVHRPDQAVAVEQRVKTITVSDLILRHGIPYYLKMDVEGSETAVFSELANSGVETPEFISTEAHSEGPLQALKGLGYSKYRLINQIKLNDWELPNPPLEGNYVEKGYRVHWSGSFGRELHGSNWYEFDEIVELFRLFETLKKHETIAAGWLDVHATK